MATHVLRLFLFFFAAHPLRLVNAFLRDPFLVPDLILLIFLFLSVAFTLLIAASSSGIADFVNCDVVLQIYIALCFSLAFEHYQFLL